MRKASACVLKIPTDELTHLEQSRLDEFAHTLDIDCAVHSNLAVSISDIDLGSIVFTLKKINFNILKSLLTLSEQQIQTL